MEISVIMSVYNTRPDYLSEAIESILHQTYENFEFLIIDDGTTDKGTLAVLERYRKRDQRIRMLVNQGNAGLTKSLNKGLREAGGKYIARMDSDDIARRSRFKTQLEILDLNPHIDVVGGDISEFIGDKQNVVGKRTLPVTDKEIKRYAKKRCPFNHMTVMYRKAAVMKAGGYQDWFWNEDYYLWIRMQERGMVFANTGTVLVDVRVGEEMYRRRGGWKYYKSEIRLQKYMLDHRVISYGVYMMNCSKRFIVQVLMTSRMREWTYKALIRS